MTEEDKDGEVVVILNIQRRSFFDELGDFIGWVFNFACNVVLVLLILFLLFIFIGFMSF